MPDYQDLRFMIITFFKVIWSLYIKTLQNLKKKKKSLTAMKVKSYYSFILAW